MDAASRDAILNETAVLDMTFGEETICDATKTYETKKGGTKVDKSFYKRLEHSSTMGISFHFKLDEQRLMQLVISSILRTQFPATHAS